MCEVKVKTEARWASELIHQGTPRFNLTPCATLFVSKKKINSQIVNILSPKKHACITNMRSPRIKYKRNSILMQNKSSIRWDIQFVILYLLDLFHTLHFLFKSFFKDGREYTKMVQDHFSMDVFSWEIITVIVHNHPAALITVATFVEGMLRTRIINAV